MSRSSYSSDFDTDGSDESSTNSTIRKSKNHQPNNKSEKTESLPVNINEVLKRALEKAADPGLGDEEPEVLTDPNVSDPSKKKAVLTDEEKSMKEIEDMKLKLLLEEEKRVAELNFDPNAILPSENMRERSKYIPLRLTYEERKTLRLVNAAINVSDYTNVVDIPYKNRAKRQHIQLQQVVAFLSGLISALDYEAGQNVLMDRNFQPYENIIQNSLEIARRYKITNPEKMRSEYGKLIYLMQDADSSEIKPLLGIETYRPIKTVYSLFEEFKTLEILDNELIAIATQEILPSKDKNRSLIQLEIKRKEKAVEKLVKTYATGRLSAELIRQCLYSISDNNSFLNSNKKPVEDCIALLHHYFSPNSLEKEFSLAIEEGQSDSLTAMISTSNPSDSGVRLTHSHETQFHYVHQSLALWSAILEDMFRLWYLSEQDLLTFDSNIDANQSCYELRQTGQGYQRVQQSPRVYKAMHEILNITKHKLSSWVGSSVIHLGDNNVPNALIFIDKYVQVARILGPLVNTLSNIEKACDENDGIKNYIAAYGGLNHVKKVILVDFFRFGFDGSGGFNDFEAGSCIDGRLTSAWNWCSKLANKPYYPLFRMTGFLSFDGEFDK